MLRSVRNFAKTNPFLRRLIGYNLASSGLVDGVFKSYKLSPEWQNRANAIYSSADNALIPRVPEAGLVKGGKQIMHNGIKINLGSYYGPEITQILIKNKGVHEPQEERVFAEVLKTMPRESVMIEMGAFWSFYSMWFSKEVPGAKNYMIDPDGFNLGHGKRNFRLNGLKGDFVQGFIGAKSEKSSKIPMIAIDDFVKEKQIPFIHMLHSDIQGYEYDMLQGTKQCFENKKIGYIFISTHSNDLHSQCLGFLKAHEFVIIANANLDQSYSEDGLIAARAPYFPGIGPLNISLKQ